jgi:O-antigen/teichoic acid export membrane protein
MQVGEGSADVSLQPSRRRATRILFITQCVSFAFVVAQGIVLVPLYLRHIDVATYGGWLASSQVLNWITLIDPGTDEAVRQRSAHAYGRREFGEVGELIGAGILINLVAAMGVFLVGVLVAALMEGRFGLTGLAANSVSRALLILAGASAVTTAAYALGSPLLALQRASIHGVIYVGGTVAALIATVGLLYAGWGVSAIPAGLLVRGSFWLAGWGVSLGHLTRNGEAIRIYFRLQGAKGLVKLSAFTWLGKISSALQTGMDGVLIGASLGASSTAGYILTGRMIDAARTLPDRIGTAVQPSLAHLFGEARPEKIRLVTARLFRLTFLSSAFLTSIAVVFNRDIMRLWVGEQLFGGARLTILLGLAAYLSNLLNSSYHVMFASGAVREATVTTTLQGVLKVALAYMLLKYLGVSALPTASLIAALLIGVPLLLFRSFSIIRFTTCEQWTVVRAALSSYAICIAAGIPLLYLRFSFSVPEVMVSVFGFAVLLMSLLYAIHRPFREEARSALAWLRGVISDRRQTA